MTAVLVCSRPLFVFTDAKSIVGTITFSKQLRENRLMNDGAGIRRACRFNEIDSVALVHLSQYLAENFTQHTGINIFMKNIHTEHLKLVIE